MSMQQSIDNAIGGQQVMTATKPNHNVAATINTQSLCRGNTYPTDKTLPVSFKLASSETPLILSSKMAETSVGAALAEANL